MSASGQRLEEQLKEITVGNPKVNGKAVHEPLWIAPASSLAGKPAPLPREWTWADLIPAGRVTSFLANGGSGKTTIAAQLAVHVATGRSLYGHEVISGPVVGIFCEDETEELNRRIIAACEAEQIRLTELTQLFALSRDGHDNVLCTFEKDQIVLTPFYHQLEAEIALRKAKLAIVDTAADVFAGDFMSTPHVRQFIKVALGGLCVRHGCAVLLIAHPSATAMSTGDGGGFSVAWNNSVRSRLFLRRPQTEDKEAAKDKRVLEVKKANYGPDGTCIPLVYRNGCFVPDDDPIEESKAVKSQRVDTMLAIAIVQVFKDLAPDGTVLPFRRIVERLKEKGAVEGGPDDTIRKRVSRTLKGLSESKVIKALEIPRGSYQMARES
jgi:RecA-family ATPase